MPIAVDASEDRINGIGEAFRDRGVEVLSATGRGTRAGRKRARWVFARKGGTPRIRKAPMGGEVQELGILEQPATGRPMILDDDALHLIEQDLVRYARHTRK